jgi:hypothetical protein
MKGIKEEIIETLESYVKDHGYDDIIDVEQDCLVEELVVIFNNRFEELRVKLEAKEHNPKRKGVRNAKI